MPLETCMSGVGRTTMVLIHLDAPVMMMYREFGGVFVASQEHFTRVTTRRVVHFKKESPPVHQVQATFRRRDRTYLIPEKLETVSD